MGKKPKIAFVSNDSWGLFNFRMGIIRKLRDLDFEIILIAGEDNYSSKLIAEGFSYHPINTFVYSTNPINEIKLVRQLFEIYKKTRPDFIFHYTIKPNVYGSMMAAMLNIPSVAVVAGLGLLANHGYTYVMYISRLLYRMAGLFTKEIWFLNQSDKDFFIKKSMLSHKKAHILPGEGIDTKRFDFSPSENRRSKTTFIFAGRMLWAKGLRELAEAAEVIKKQYPETVFQLLGFIEPLNPNSVHFEQIKEWHQSGLFEYLGETENVVPFLQNADCIVLPSYREGISRLLLEASAMGKPAIASNVVGCREIIEHKVTGFLCQPNSSKDLILAIESFLKLMPEERRQMGLNARMKVEKEFDEKIVFKEYIKALDKYNIG